MEATAKQPRESLYIPDLAAAANRIIQALVTLCTWQKYEDSWNKISCDDWTKKYTLLLVSMYYCTYRGSLDSGNSSSLPFCYQIFFPFYSEISARNTKDYRFLWYLYSMNKFCDKFPRYTRTLCTHIACLSTISSRNVEGWNAKNFAAYTADHIFNHKKML